MPQLQWNTDHIEMLGFLPMMIDGLDPRPASEQFDTGYQHGGGWHPQDRWILNKDNTASYPGDPSMSPIASAMLRDELILVYRHGYVAIVQPDRTFEMCRMD